MDFSAWQIYVAIGLIFLAIEIFVPGFVMAPIGIAALVTALFSWVVGALVWQLAFLSLVAIAIYFALAPFAKSRLNRTREKVVLGISGQVGTLHRPFESEQSPGQVKLYADVWDIALEGLDGAEIEALRNLPVGSRVRVLRTLGNRVIIQPVKD